MSNFMNKMLNFVGFDAVDEYEDEYYNETEEITDRMDRAAATERFDEPVQPETFTAKRSASRSLKPQQESLHQMKLVVMQPANFEEARDIANHLKSKKPIVMNLETVEKEVARRIVDFLSGAVYALDGNIQKVSNGIFLIVPYNVDIMSDMAGIKASGASPWMG